MQDPWLGRFFVQDAYADKYRSITPYQYAANDPINLVDINGDSIWFSFQHNKAGELTGVTMNVTGKVMNLSSDNVDMDNAVSDISSSISEGFNGTIEVNGEDVSFSTNVELSEASSMDEVSKSDHLFVIADSKGIANGVTNYPGGQISYLNAVDFPDNGTLSGFLGVSDTRTATHEFGHMAGLPDLASGRNLMVQGQGSTHVTNKQLQKIFSRGIRGGLNIGENYSKSFTGKKYPNRKMTDIIGRNYDISKIGIIMRLERLK